MPEQLGDLLDDDGEHHRLQVGAGLAAVLDRPAEQHQPGRRRRPAAHQRRQRHGVARPSRRAAAACPRRRTPRGRAGPASGCRCRATMLEHELVEALAARSAAPGGRAAAAAIAGPRIPRPRRSRSAAAGRSTPQKSQRSRVVDAASLIGCRPARRYRRRRESCPPLFAHRLRPSRGHHADLRLRRPDGGRSARSRRTPSRTPTTCASVHGERLSAPRGWEVLRLAPDPSTRAARPTTTCSRWPTPSARPAGPVAATRSPAPPPTTARAARRRGAATCACSPPTDARPTAGDRVARLAPVSDDRPRQRARRLQGVRRAGHGPRPDRRGAGPCVPVGASCRSPVPTASSSATTCGRARRAWPAAFADGRRRRRAPTW